MRQPFHWLRTRVPLRYWAWIHAFVALGIGWGHAIALYPPESYDGVLNLRLVLRMGITTALGCIIAIVGMILTRASSLTTQHRGLWIELVGTVLLVGGPLQFFAIQIGFYIQGFALQRYALIWFAYAMIAFVLVRFAILIPALIEASHIAKTNKRRVR